MAVHVGPLQTAPNRDVPAEVVRVLGKRALAGVDAHVHIRSGIDSLLGDTHLTVVEGRLHVIARRSSLDPLEEVELRALPEVDESGYRSVLLLPTTAGEKRVEIGATEENAVHALVDALAPEAVDAPAAPPPQAAEVPGSTEAGEASDPAHRAEVPLDEARAALLAVLGDRLAARKAKLRADRIAHQRSPKKPAARVAPVALRAELGVAMTDEDGDGIPDPPGERARPARRPDPPTPQSSLLGLAVLSLLVIVGFLAVVSRLLAEAK